MLRMKKKGKPIGKDARKAFEKGTSNTQREGEREFFVVFVVVFFLFFPLIFYLLLIATLRQEKKQCTDTEAPIMLIQGK